MEWEFPLENHRVDVLISCDGRTIKHIGEYKANIRLKNKCKENNKQIVKIKAVKKVLTECNIVAHNSLIYSKSFCYKSSGRIEDSYTPMKQLKNNVKEGDCIVIEQKVFKKLENGEYIYVLKMQINEDEVVRTLYKDRTQRIIELTLDNGEEVELEVFSRF